MAHCPSHDWDRHVDELDAAAAEQCAFYANNADRILATAAAMLVNPNISPGVMAPADCASLIDRAAEIVRIVVGRGVLE